MMEESVVTEYPAFIHTHFRPYYNENQKIPEYSRAAVTGNVLEKLEAVSLPESHPDHQLFGKVIAAVQQRFSEPSVTYRLIGYLETFTAAVRYVEENKTEQSLPVTLADILIPCNPVEKTNAHLPGKLKGEILQY